MRLCSRRASAVAAGTAAATSGVRRTYVSESKKDSATVNVETTIKADQKAFLQQTGTRVENATMPTTGMGAEAMMSPAAGAFSRPLPIGPADVIRHLEASHCDG